MGLSPSLFSVEVSRLLSLASVFTSTSWNIATDILLLSFLVRRVSLLFSTYSSLSRAILAVLDWSRDVSNLFWAVSQIKRFEALFTSGLLAGSFRTPVFWL